MTSATLQTATITTRGAFRHYRAILQHDARQLPIWYAMPAEAAPPLPEQHDAFLLPVLFHCMKHVDSLHINGAVSRLLLENLEQFMAAWQCWLPDTYRPLTITCEDEYDQEPVNQQAVMAFTGGVDSCTTLLRHRHHLVGRRSKPIKAGIIFHGLDIPLTDQAAFRTACHHSRAITRSHDVPLIPVVTNARTFAQSYGNEFLPLIAGGLHLFSGQAGYGLLGNDEYYTDVYMPWSSNPYTNRYLTSGHFQLITDGWERRRVDKVQTIAGDPLIAKHLRVCWQPEADGANCNHCEKCLRTVLNYKVNGLDVPTALTDHATPERIRQIHFNSPVQRLYLEECLQRAEANGYDATPWGHAIRQRLAPSEARPVRDFLRRQRSRARRSLRYLSECLTNLDPRYS